MAAGEREASAATAVVASRASPFSLLSSFAAKQACTRTALVEDEIELQLQMQVHTPELREGFRRELAERPRSACELLALRRLLEPQLQASMVREERVPLQVGVGASGLIRRYK